MKDEYDERSNGRDAQTKVIYDQLTLKIDFLIRPFRFFGFRRSDDIIIFNNLSVNYRIQIFNGRGNFCSNIPKQKK